MKRLILKLLFNNYERGLIKEATCFAAYRLGMTLSETAREDSRTYTDISFMFPYKRDKDNEPFPLEVAADFKTAVSRVKYLEGYVRNLETGLKNTEKALSYKDWMETVHG